MLSYRLENQVNRKILYLNDLDCHWTELNRLGSAVCEISASDEELEYIRATFSIPMYPGSIITWYGDIARFIASNIKQ